MITKVITQPTEIISVTEAAEFIRIDSPSAETTAIENMIKTARQWVEEYLQRLIGIQTVEIITGKFPTTGRKQIHLPSPLTAVVTVKYIDTNNTEQTLVEDTDYYVSIDSEPCEIVPLGAWPLALAKANSVRIQVTAGYSDPGDSPLLSQALPVAVRTAMLMQTADLYENRGAQTERPLTANPTLERMLSMYRLGMGI